MATKEATEVIKALEEAIQEGLKLLNELKNGEERRKIATQIKVESREQKVSKIMHNVGIPAHIQGHRCLREAIIMVMNDSSYITNMTTRLYPEVAEKCNTSVDGAERGIRYAIETGWNRADADTLYEIFGETVDSKKGKPTNSEFIAVIADMLLLEEKE